MKETVGIAKDTKIFPRQLTLFSAKYVFESSVPARGSRGVHSVSEHTATAAHPPDSATAGAVSTPEFDVREKAMFGHDDAHAVTVIGKMLVGFFFYSLIIMAAVALWTKIGGGQVSEQPPQNIHAAESEE
jgi:hypothetical protein